jgi:dTDP-4-amino-4,6-dideoxygalactose transaminase
MRDDFLVFGQPQIHQAEIDEVVDSMESYWLGTGPKVARFEKEFMAYTGAPNAAALSSCTAGLHLSMLALDLKEGDEVITTPLTFCATVNAIIHVGAKPVLADVDPVTGNIDPDEIRRKISNRTRALLPVHMTGLPCDMDEIMQIAKDHELLVVEDCAHAIETQFRGRQAGTIGDVGVFSFYATKNVATGEGGMVISANEELIARIKTLSLHGMTADAWSRFSDTGYKHYFVVEAGFKYNMMDLQAAIGIHQLARIEDNWERRQEIWLRYREALAKLPVDLPPVPGNHVRHAYHLFTLGVRDNAPVSRDELLVQLTEKKIGVGVHYMSIPEHPFYQDKFGWRPEEFPHAMRIGRQTISLPLSSKLTDSDVNDVIAAVMEILE